MNAYRASFAAVLLSPLFGCGDGPSAPEEPAPVAAVFVTPSTANIEPGSTIQLTAEPRDEAGRALTGRVVTWSSSDPGVASVSASGLVTAVAAGGPVTITATSEGRSGSAGVTVIPPPVATVTMSHFQATVVQQGSVQLVASTRDAQGTILTGRVVTWTSSNTEVASVSAAGFVSALQPGSVTITATSEGKSGSTTVHVIAGIITGIRDIRVFLNVCPTSDPAYATIRADFELRENGQLLASSIDCVEPFSSTPTPQLTDELIAVQVLRTAYYMSQGTQGRLPWTTKSLYDWMKGNIAGINFKTAPGQLYCCDIINGRLFFSTSRQDASQRDHKRTWPGISGSLHFYAHEIRHADAGAPGHVNGCAAFPLPTDPAGCDATYDLNNLGAYGVQYWLSAGWATGSLSIGIVCAPDADIAEYLNWHLGSLSQFRSRFVTNVPPAVTAIAAYGAPCTTP